MSTARQAISLKGETRRTLEERLALRFPAFLELLGRAFMRLPPRSRLRRSLVRRRLRQIYGAFNRGDIEAGAVLGNDPDTVLHTPKDAAGVIAVDLEDVYRGHRGIAAAYEQTLRSPAWSDPRYELDEVIDCGDKILVRARFLGRGKRSGVEVEQPVTYINTLGRDGRAVRTDAYWDHDKALEAAGLTE